MLLPKATSKLTNSSSTILTKQFYNASIASMKPNQSDDNGSSDNEPISLKNNKKMQKRRGRKPLSSSTSQPQPQPQPQLISSSSSTSSSSLSISTQTNPNITRSKGNNMIQNSIPQPSVLKLKPPLNQLPTNTTATTTTTMSNNNNNNSRELKSVLKETSVNAFPVVPMPNLPSLLPIPHINENPKPIPIVELKSSLDNKENNNSDSEKDENIEGKELKEYDPEAEIDINENKNNKSENKSENYQKTNDSNSNKIFEDSDLFALFDEPAESKKNINNPSVIDILNIENKESLDNSKKEALKKKKSLFDLTPSYPTRLLPPAECALIEAKEEDHIENKYEERIDVDEDNMPCKVLLIKSSQLPLIIGDEKGSVINHIIGSSGAQIILPRSDEFVKEHYKKIIIKGTGEEIEHARNMIVRRL